MAAKHILGWHGDRWGPGEEIPPSLSLSLLLPSSSNLGKIQEEARGQRSIAFQSTDREREEISSLRFRGTIEGILGFLLLRSFFSYGE